MDNANVNINDIVAFFLEVLVFVSLAVWAWRHGIGEAVTGKWAAMIGILIVAVALWALFVSPKSVFELPALEIILRIAIIACGVVAFAQITTPNSGIIVGAIAAVNVLLMYVGPFAR